MPPGGFVLWPGTVLLCGAFSLEHTSGAHPLLAVLPRVIHIKGEQGRMADGLPDTLNLIVQKSHSQRPGAEAMLRRLTDVLFIQVVRAWVESQPPGTSGWLGALRDPQIGTALGLIHRYPEQVWTVEGLARAVAMSRSAFSSRFTALVQEPPMEYLTRWRMRTATNLLKNGLDTHEVARRIGYESEVAFRKAFKRELGITPGGYRRGVGRQ